MNCTRSHPHEEMNAECVRLTETARQNNALAHHCPVVVAPGADADEMNRLHGEAFGIDWVYPPNHKISGA